VLIESNPYYQRIDRQSQKRKEGKWRRERLGATSP
jgi:hypothetical protein